MTDRHFWKVKVIDGMDGNGGGNGGILPCLVRLANQDSGNNETETDNPRPQNLCCPGLKRTVSLDFVPICLESSGMNRTQKYRLTSSGNLILA